MIITKKKLRKVICEMINELVDKVKNDDTITDDTIVEDCPSLTFYCGEFGALFNLSAKMNLYSQKERDMILNVLKEYKELKKEES